MLQLLRLERRCVPAGITVSQVGTALFVDMDTPGFVSVQQGQVLTSQGNFQTTGPITNVTVNGSKGDDVVEVNINAAATILGNNGNDTLFGGTGTNFIDPGKGKDKVYSLLGNNFINAQGDGADLIYTNFPAQVSSDKQDDVARFFGPGRGIGSGFVGMSTSGDDAGTLYINPANVAKTTTTVMSFGKATLVVYDFGNGVQTQIFFGVNNIAYFGAGGDDTYLNFTSINEAAYGAGGKDLLFSGTGDSVILKGSGDNDVLVANGKSNDVSTNPAANSVDQVFLMNGQGNNVVRAGVNDVIFGLTRKDTLIPQLF